MAGVRQKRNNWQIWWVVDGKRLWATLDIIDYPKKKDAMNEACSREADGEIVVRRHASFKDYALAYIKRNKISPESSRKAHNMLERLTAFSPNCSIRDFTPDKANDYLSFYKDKFSAKTLLDDIEYIKTIVKDAVWKGITKGFDLKEIRLPKVEKKLVVLPTQAERQNILDWVKTNRPVYYVWLYFVVTRGWRQGEFREMLISDIDLDNKIMYIRHTKTDEQRQAALTEQDCVVLNEHFILLKRLGKFSDSGVLIPPQRGDITSRNTLLRIVKEACKNLGIAKNITNHSFRHWIVSKILSEGYGIESVKAITGHRDSDTIYRYYSHPMPKAIEGAIAATRVNTGFNKKCAKSCAQKGKV
jgi:integrase/recombinase XerD